MRYEFDSELSKIKRLRAVRFLACRSGMDFNRAALFHLEHEGYIKHLSSEEFGRANLETGMLPYVERDIVSQERALKRHGGIRRLVSSYHRTKFRNGKKRVADLVFIQKGLRDEEAELREYVDTGIGYVKLTGLGKWALKVG